MLRPVDGRVQPFVADLRTGRGAVPVKITNGRQLLRGCEWASSERLICSWIKFFKVLGGRFGEPTDGYPSRGSRVVRLLAVDYDGGHLLELVPPAHRPPLVTVGNSTLREPWHYPGDEPEHRVIGYLPRDPDHVLLTTSREHLSNYSVYRLNIRNNALELVTPWEESVGFWSGDDRGRVRMGIGIGEPNATWRRGTRVLAEDPDGGFKDVATPHVGAVWFPPRVLGYAPDGLGAYVEGYDGASGKTVIWRVDAATLAVEGLVASHPRLDVVGTPIRGIECGVVGFSDDATGALTWLDASFGRDVATLNNKLPGTIRAVPSMTADCWRIVVITHGGGRTPTYYLHDRKSGATRRLGSHRPELDGRLGDTQALSYEALDGQRIDAVLTLPAQPKTVPPPLVVMPVGGPVVPTGGYDPWAEFLASRGYAVLRPAVRGTSGRGDDHLLAGFTMWGARMQDDMAAGVDWLSAQGLANTDRVCYAGRGYGGYLALVGAFGDGSHARCAATLAFDAVRHTMLDFRVHRYHWLWQGWLRQPTKYWYWASGALSEQVTGTEPNDRHRGKTMVSPLLDAKHAGFPILISRGKRGPVEFDEHSGAFASALRDAGMLERMVAEDSPREAEFLVALAAFLDREIGRRD